MSDTNCGVNAEGPERGNERLAVIHLQSPRHLTDSGVAYSSETEASKDLYGV